MAIANFTIPFVPPPPTAYITPQSFGEIQAAGINSLVYDTTRYTQTRQNSFPPSPNRRQPTAPRKIKDNRDPYRNQYPQKNRYRTVPSQTTTLKDNVDDYDEYYNEPDYETEKSENSFDKNYASGRRESELNGYYEENASRTSSKSKRRLPAQQPPEEERTQTPQEQGWPNHPPTYKRIANTFNSAPEPGARTSIHAVLDFDDDFEDYSYEDDDIEPLPPSLQKSPKPQVTPIEGPIFIKNGSVPVVPLYSYPTVNNGSLVQIPILWTALSLALGLEIHGEIIRGVPCIKRFHQLFCPTAGNSYPIGSWIIRSQRTQEKSWNYPSRVLLRGNLNEEHLKNLERIERFIDDNKALMKRMYGEFQMSTEYGPPAREAFEARRRNVKRQANQDSPEPPPESPKGKPDSYFARHRPSRQSFRSGQSDSGRVDACESKIEIVTPYWASNSAGKIRAIVNTQHFEQAIHQEVCSKVQTKRCVGDCGCEQKYKWHRLLAYDPDNDCKGIFMDWFLFPSCCVCRCAQTFGN